MKNRICLFCFTLIAIFKRCSHVTGLYTFSCQKIRRYNSRNTKSLTLKRTACPRRKKMLTICKPQSLANRWINRFIYNCLVPHYGCMKAIPVRLYSGTCPDVHMMFGWFGEVIRENQAGLLTQHKWTAHFVLACFGLFSQRSCFLLRFGALFYARVLSVPGSQAKDMGLSLHLCLILRVNGPY